MRRWMVGMCLFFAATTLAPAAAQDCPACTYYETFRQDGGSTLFNDILAQLKSRPAAIVSLAGGAFCNSGPGAGVASDLIRATDDQFGRAKAIGEKIAQCPNACSPTLDDTDYCAYGARLVVDRYRLGAIGLRLAELGRLYERASAEELPPVQILAAELTRHGAAALAVLRRTQAMLASGEMGESPDAEWDASVTEVTGLFDAVALLADFALIAGDVAQLETALETASRQINTLRNDLQAVARRSHAPRDRQLLDFERRILTAASELAFVMASLQSSAANAPVVDDYAENARRASVCMNQLSISAIQGSEAPGKLDETLGACRSFDGCGDKAAINVPANLSPLKAFLQDQMEARKQTRRLVDSLCGSP